MLNDLKKPSFIFCRSGVETFQQISLHLSGQIKLLCPLLKKNTRGLL